MKKKGVARIDKQKRQIKAGSLRVRAKDIYLRCIDLECNPILK